MTEVDVEHGVFQPSVERDLLKLVVVERHRGLGVGVGIVNGFQLKKGRLRHRLLMIHITSSPPERTITTSSLQLNI